MSRALWFVAGAGAGAYGLIRGRRAAEAFTVDGMRDRVEALLLGARLFRDEVAQGAAEREPELRERYGLHPHGRPELTAGVATDVGTGSPDADDSDKREGP